MQRASFTNTGTMSMTSLRISLLFLLTFLVLHSSAQKVFSEGTITYQVKMGPDDPEFKPGMYTITIKDDFVKKEMKLNGLDYIIILNCRTNKVTSLRNLNGRKYAIELKMEDITNDQVKFTGFRVAGETNDNKKIAGCTVHSGTIMYKDGSHAPVYFSRDWKPVQPITYERFPGADFLPLEFFYKDASGITMSFLAQKVQPEPIDNAEFRVPLDYKIISNAEYQQISR